MLRIEHFSKYYGNKAAVEDLSLHVEPGDIYGFIGHNGAGKTTTIRGVTGVAAIQKGEITIDGISMNREPLRCKERIAYIPDNPDLYEHLTGMQYLRFMADIYQVGEQDRTRRLPALAGEFDMEDVLGDLIGSYSHGMKQKIAILAALLHRPRLMVLDEPFVGLDPKAALTLKEHMHGLCDEGGAIFFSTHVLDVAEKLCNKVAIIKEGHLVAAGPMETLRGNQSLEAVFMEVTEGGR